MKTNLTYILAFSFVQCLVSTAIMIMTKDLYLHGSHINPLQTVAIRNIIALVVLLPVIVPMVLKTYKRVNYRLSLSRGVISTISMSLWALCYSNVPLHTATSVSFLAPIITFLLAGVFLSEKITKLKLSAMFCSFGGVVLTLQPELVDVDFTFLFALIICVVLFGAGNVLNKVQTAIVNPPQLISYYTIWVAVLSFIFAIPVWQDLAFLDVIKYLLPIGILTAIANYFGLLVYKNAKIATIQSLDFLRLIFAILADIFVFKNDISLRSIFGACVIFLSAFCVIYSDYLFHKCQK